MLVLSDKETTDTALSLTELVSKLSMMPLKLGTIDLELQCALDFKSTFVHKGHYPIFFFKEIPELVSCWSKIITYLSQ